MESKGLISSNPSAMLWLGAAIVAILGMHACLEYLRRLRHQGPIVGWRDLLLGAVALQICATSTMIVGIAGQGLLYEIGYHPLKLLGSMLLLALLAVIVMFWASWRVGWISLIGASLLLAPLTLAQQIAVVWSLGTEPAVPWRMSYLVYAGVLLFAGFASGLYLVMRARRGTKEDRWGRRVLAALLAAAAVVFSQEIVLKALQLTEQTASAYVRLLPEVAVTLLAGAGMPIVFLVMLVDQHMQRRIRHASRRNRHRLGYGDSAVSTHNGDLPRTR